jgi:hypothetical protein
MQLKSAFRNWQLSREVPPIDQEHIQPTIPNGSSRSSTTTSTDNNDPDAPLQPLPSHRPNPSRILRMYHVCRREVVAYGKPGLKRDLASWTGIMIIGTSFMMYALFLPNLIPS